MSCPELASDEPNTFAVECMTVHVPTVIVDEHKQLIEKAAKSKKGVWTQVIGCMPKQPWCVVLCSHATTS